MNKLPLSHVLLLVDREYGTLETMLQMLSSHYETVDMRAGDITPIQNCVCLISVPVTHVHRNAEMCTYQHRYECRETTENPKDNQY
jgi:hypothetical protein